MRQYWVGCYSFLSPSKAAAVDRGVATHRKQRSQVQVAHNLVTFSHEVMQPAVCTCRRYQALRRARAHGCCTAAGALVSSSENKPPLPLPSSLTAQGGSSDSISAPLSETPIGAPNMMLRPCSQRGLSGHAADRRTCSCDCMWLSCVRCLPAGNNINPEHALALGPCAPSDILHHASQRRPHLWRGKGPVQRRHGPQPYRSKAQVRASQERQPQRAASWRLRLWQRRHLSTAMQSSWVSFAVSAAIGHTPAAHAELTSRRTMAEWT